MLPCAAKCIALFFSVLGVAACGSSVDDGKSTGAIQEVTSCGGLAGKSCPTGQACVDDPADDCDPASGGADCLGICVVPQGSKSSCGGFAGTLCPSGEQCVDDPSDGCDPANGGADCPGICVTSPGSKSCGGFAGTPCPSGEQCVDDPADECDPANGGADCPGICVQATVQCSGLDVCACQATPGCQASFDGCHCPGDFGCEPQVECFCGGGAFLGCSSAN